MSHGGGGGGAVLRNADGSDMSKTQVLIKRRGAFKWLPVVFSNDLVHGSWWFVAGSAAVTLFALVPLIQPYLPFYNPQQDDLLPTTDFDIEWSLMAFSGFFFTIGSAAFVRAFEEPTKRPLFWYNKHFQTDELLAAWLFLWGTVPAVPYTLIFFIVDPTSMFLGGVFVSLIMVFGCVLFVVACYPSDKKRNNYVLPFCLRYCGANMWVVKHLANDWLAATWFFLVANIIGCFISFVLLFAACGSGNQETIFIWLSGSVEAMLFLVGSLYFVAGSYPHASQFYYAAGRNATGQTFEESQGIIAHRIDGHSGAAKAKGIPRIDVGIGKRGSVMAQQMEGRVKLAPTVNNPLLAGAAAAGGGRGHAGTPGKMALSRPAIKVGRANSGASPSPSASPQATPAPSSADLQGLAAAAAAAAASVATAGTGDDDEDEGEVEVEVEYEEDEEGDEDDDDDDDEEQAGGKAGYRAVSR